MASTHEGLSGRKYGFDGPFDDPDRLMDAEGVYSILCRRADRLTVVDVGESEKIRSRVKNHNREECWRRECRGRLRYAALYMPGSTEEARRRVEKDIRAKYRPPCGEN
jgi:hypothetical protein